jgi:hypothetical protein
MPSTWSFTQFVKEKLTFQKLNSRFQGIKDILDTCYTTNDASSLSTANKLVLRDSNGDAAIRNLTLSQLNAHSITDIFEADGTTVKRATTITNLPTAVRQTVIQGQVDANGQANFLQAGSTPLTIDILADSIPLILSFAYGNNTTYGPVNFIESIESNQTAFWSNLPSNQAFIQLYIDRNISTGELTGGYTLLETAYGLAPSHANTKHWYDYNNTAYMKVSDGSNWSNVQRIMIGECTTDADSVTSVVCYALKGQYDSEWFNVASNQEYSKNHSIGRGIDDLIVYGWVRTDSTKKKRVINNLSSGGYSGLAGNDAGDILAVLDNSVYLRTAGKLHPSYATGVNDTSRYPDVDAGSGQARIFVKRGF